MVQLFAVDKTTGKLKAVQVNSSGELIIAGNDDANASITAIETSTSTTQTDVATIKTDIADIKTEVVATQMDTAAIKADIAAIKAILDT
jgi:septal ring factor EnvC (AmiA/AmiB activator)